MDYALSRDAVNAKYTDWKSAILMEIKSSLGLQYDMAYVKEYEIDSVLKYNLLLSGITGLLHTRFRGEARFHSNPCLPIISRRGLETKTHEFELSEIDRFKNSEKGAEFKSKLPRGDPSWWMLAQHYKGYETRLLDITRNALVALYFACDKHPDKDGYVYIFHSIDKTAQDLNDEYSSYTDHVKDLDEYYRENHFVYMRPNIAMDRIQRQEGEFLWVKNYTTLKQKGLFDSNQIIPILIKSEYKQKLLKELNDPQGININFLNLQTDS